jgi:transcriptional regulator with XRE-family HTH domain
MTTATTKSLHRYEYRAILDTFRALRARLGPEWTQMRFAEALGRSQTYVSAVERGAIRMDALQIYDWVSLCGASMEEWGKMVDEGLRALGNEAPRARKAAKKAPKKKAGV